MSDEAKPKEIKTNISTELAKRRTRNAAERTLMAWTRTALSLIGFGFGIDKITQAILKAQKVPNPGIEESVRNFGMAFIGLGVLCLLVAGIAHWREIKSLERTDFKYESPFPLALMMAMLIALFGIYTLVMIFLKLM